MVRDISTKATVEQVSALARQYDIKGASPEVVLADLKKKHYKIKNVHFQATQVAYAVAGRQEFRAELVALINSKQLKSIKDIKQYLGA